MRGEASDSCHQQLDDASKYISTDYARIRTVSIVIRKITTVLMGHETETCSVINTRSVQLYSTNIV